MARNTARVAVVVLVLVVSSAAVVLAGSPKWGGSWVNGPVTTFGNSWSRFDGAYYEPNGLVYFLGGRYGTNTDGSVWSFNPATSVYADTGVDMPVPISNYTVNVLTDGSGAVGFYTFGGRDAAGGLGFWVQVYYPGSNTAAQLPVADNYPGSVSCNGALNVVYNNQAYVAGGFNGTVVGGQTWVFDPTAASGSRWTQLASANLNPARGYIMGAAVDGLIYAIGGATWDGTNLVSQTTVEVLDPAAGTPTWTPVAVLPEVCSESRAWGFDTGSLYEDPVDGTPLAGKVISGCGVWSVPVASVYAYTVATNTWEAFPSLIMARRSQAGEFLPLATTPALWVWGGYDSSGSAETNTVEYYALGVVPVELQSFTIE